MNIDNMTLEELMNTLNTGQTQTTQSGLTTRMLNPYISEGVPAGWEGSGVAGSATVTGVVGPAMGTTDEYTRTIPAPGTYSTYSWIVEAPAPIPEPEDMYTIFK